MINIISGSNEYVVELVEQRWMQRRMEGRMGGDVGADKYVEETSVRNSRSNGNNKRRRLYTISILKYKSKTRGGEYIL